MNLTNFILDKLNPSLRAPTMSLRGAVKRRSNLTLSSRACREIWSLFVIPVKTGIQKLLSLDPLVKPEDDSVLSLRGAVKRRSNLSLPLWKLTVISIAANSALVNNSLAVSKINIDEKAIEGQLPPGVNTIFKVSNPQAIVAQIFQIAISVSAVLFIILFVIAGLQYLFSSGNEETTTKAKHTMLDAVIGLAIVLVAYALGTTVLKLIGVSI